MGEPALQSMLAIVSLSCLGLTVLISLVLVEVASLSAADVSSRNSLSQLVETLWTLRCLSTASVTSGAQPQVNRLQLVPRTRTSASQQLSLQRFSELNSGVRVQTERCILRCNLSVQKLQLGSGFSWFEQLNFGNRPILFFHFVQHTFQTFVVSHWNSKSAEFGFLFTRHIWCFDHEYYL